jgi:hypothetical protein
VVGGVRTVRRVMRAPSTVRRPTIRTVGTGNTSSGRRSPSTSPCGGAAGGVAAAGPGFVNSVPGGCGCGVGVGVADGAGVGVGVGVGLGVLVGAGVGTGVSEVGSGVGVGVGCGAGW